VKTKILTATQRTCLGNIIARGGVFNHGDCASGELEGGRPPHMGRMRKGDVRKSVLHALERMGLVRAERQAPEVCTGYFAGLLPTEGDLRFFATAAGCIAFGPKVAVVS
jgi:hypothetical protein